MNRLLVIFALVGGSMVVLLALLVALASASASLANGVANAAASSALLASQCTGTLMVVIALFAGSALGAGVAHWQHLDAPAHPPLSAPQPGEHAQRLLPPKAEEDADLPLKGWGF